jgi:hypothetical protein
VPVLQPNPCTCANRADALAQALAAYTSARQDRPWTFEEQQVVRHLAAVLAQATSEAATAVLEAA